MAEHTKDRPWLIRTYAGHSTAKASNALYRSNLSRGQTGLSVAFDLPTQTGYDSDHVLAQGEVGKVGVPVSLCWTSCSQRLPVSLSWFCRLILSVPNWPTSPVP